MHTIQPHVSPIESHDGYSSSQRRNIKHIIIIISSAEILNLRNESCVFKHMNELNCHCRCKRHSRRQNAVVVLKANLAVFSQLSLFIFIDKILHLSVYSLICNELLFNFFVLKNNNVDSHETLSARLVSYVLF